MGELTERGKIVAAGGAELAAVDGDDTLTAPEDQPGGTDEAAAAAEQTSEVEAAGGSETADNSELPGPADIPPAPVVETADADTSGTETR